MHKWKPISIEKLSEMIINEELEMDHSELRLWDAIKIDPNKWEEPTYGGEGGGFWVSAIIGNVVLWYNDIEDGWNVSNWKKYGHIDHYSCNQSSLREAMSHIRFIMSERSIR